MTLTPRQVNRVLKKLPWWLQLIVLVTVVLSSFWLQRTPTEPALVSAQLETESVGLASGSADLFLVTRVVDGDTLKVRIADTEETVRVVGINTPETVDPRKPVECYGKQATQAMKDLVLGQSVRLESDPTQQNTDRYGRLLRFVFLPDGRDVGLELIQAGFAQESLYSTTPHRYHEAYVIAQQQAQGQALGLWSSEACL